MLRSEASPVRCAAVAAALAISATALASAPAAARGFVGFSIGAPIVPAYPVYPAYPPYYAYYPPAPPVYAPPPAYAPPAYAAPSSPTSGDCREYRSTAMIDGRPQPTFGTACRQADGTWRIVQ